MITAYTIQIRCGSTSSNCTVHTIQEVRGGIQKDAVSQSHAERHFVVNINRCHDNRTSCHHGSAASCWRWPDAVLAATAWWGWHRGVRPVGV